MDIDDHPSQSSHTPPSPKYALQPTNTLAGPSTLPEQVLPPIFLPPPSEPRATRPYFDSTQDLLARFQLLAAYDKYVRPFAPPVGLASTSTGSISGVSDKGKGKEKEVPPRDIASPAAAPTPGVANDGDDEDGQGKGEKKMKNYRHMIKNIPGKHSTKKDDYLMTTMQVPPKQRIHITPFDLRTQRDAFSVSLDGLKGWNINALVAESPQAREDRKRRKELKKQAKSQVAGLATGTPSAAPATPAATTQPTPAGHASAPARTATPRPGVPPARQPQPSHVAQPGSQPRGQTPTGVGTPRSIPTPVAASGTLPTSAASARHTPIPTPATTPGPGGAPGDVRRGVKREREESVSGNGTSNGTQGGVTVVTNGWTKSSAPTNAKAGSGGVRPRPVKKPRLDMPGREVPVQQPTPHA